MGFRNIWKKEMRSLAPLYGVYCALVLLLHLILLYKKVYLDTEIMMVGALFLPFLFVSAMAIGTGYYQLHTEWRTNSIYLLLSLPIRGWKVLTAKILAVYALLLISSLWIAVSFGLILLRASWQEVRVSEAMPPLFPSLFNLALNTFWMYSLATLFLLMLVQFTFLCGQLTAKFKWIVMIGAGFGALWLVLRISPLLSNLLLWMPELAYGGVDVEVIYLHPGPFVVLLLISVGLLALNGYIFEKEVEV
ncbi:hypothetical protein ACFO9Q_01705 [Paenibacillus sp. GCM10023252]|uniref:hypothetical protein n=1 Tax=Paenibacillus sp. GCM10023252 TaxID=3252649 RepID=UPI0036126965